MRYLETEDAVEIGRVQRKEGRPVSRVLRSRARRSAGRSNSIEGVAPVTIAHGRRDAARCGIGYRTGFRPRRAWRATARARLGFRHTSLPHAPPPPRTANMPHERAHHRHASKLPSQVIRKTPREYAMPSLARKVMAPKGEDQGGGDGEAAKLLGDAARWRCRVPRRHTRREREEERHGRVEPGI